MSAGASAASSRLANDPEGGLKTTFSMGNPRRRTKVTRLYRSYTSTSPPCRPGVRLSRLFAHQGKPDGEDRLTLLISHQDHYVLGAGFVLPCHLGGGRHRLTARRPARREVQLYDGGQGDT